MSSERLGLEVKKNYISEDIVLCRTDDWKSAEESPLCKDAIICIGTFTLDGMVVY